METMSEVKQTVQYAGNQLHYTDTIVEPQPDAQDAMGNYIDEMQEQLEIYKDRGLKACWIHEGDVHHLYTERYHPQQLHLINLCDTPFVVDFQLQEIRQKSYPSNVIPFKELTHETKAAVRGIRAEYYHNEYMEGLDD